MKLYLNAVMKDKSEEEKYSILPFVIGERGRGIFNTWTCDRVHDAEVEKQMKMASL